MGPGPRDSRQERRALPFRFHAELPRRPQRIPALQHPFKKRIVLFRHGFMRREEQSRIDTSGAEAHKRGNPVLQGLTVGHTARFHRVLDAMRIAESTHREGRRKPGQQLNQAQPTEWLVSPQSLGRRRLNVRDGVHARPHRAYGMPVRSRPYRRPVPARRAP